MTDNDDPNIDESILDDALEELDDGVGVNSSVWRSWSENASPELLEDFEARSKECIREVRGRYPAHLGAGTSEYETLRRECVRALNCLTETIQGEYDADD